MNLIARAPLVALALILPAMAGCLDLLSDDEADHQPTFAELGFDGEHWPDLTGHQLTVLDHGAFFAFDQAKSMFYNLTGATVTHVSAGDAGSAYNQACLEATSSVSPTFDVVYGIDNVLFGQALTCAGGASVFEPYTPILGHRIAPQYLFFLEGDDAPGHHESDHDDHHHDAWPATPVDHGYIAINVDIHHQALNNTPIGNLHDVAANAHLFATQDPRTSSPGLGFLLATIARFPENDQGRDDWMDYWADLFTNGVKITSGWTEAYEVHFSGGYGKWLDGHVGDRPIVTSYTTSPAYEHYYEAPAETLPEVLLDRSAAFHQIQTMGIINGTANLAAAQAWIEFTLTDAFQELAAPANAIYPVVAGIDVSGTYAGIDPPPGTFSTARLDHDVIAANVDDWVADWVALCEHYGCV